jgi:hypothetical protein
MPHGLWRPALGGHPRRRPPRRRASPVLFFLAYCDGLSVGWVCVFITAVPNTKLCAWGEEDSGGHVL